MSVTLVINNGNVVCGCGQPMTAVTWSSFLDGQYTWLYWLCKNGHASDALPLPRVLTSAVSGKLIPAHEYLQQLERTADSSPGEGP